MMSWELYGDEMCCGEVALTFLFSYIQQELLCDIDIDICTFYVFSIFSHISLLKNICVCMFM